MKIDDFTEADVARFLEKVDKRGSDECWDWKASKKTGGYGAFCFRGKVHNASRIALILSGVDLDGLCALHGCDRPICCNPSHLRAGTAGDNAEDRWIREKASDWAESFGPVIGGEIIRRSRAGQPGSQIWSELRLREIANAKCRAEASEEDIREAALIDQRLKEIR